MDGYLLSAVALVALACHVFFLKRSVHLGDYMSLLISQGVLAVVLVIAALFTTTLKMPSDLTVAVLLVMSLFAIAGLYLFYIALAEGSASVVFISLCSFVLVSAIVSWVLFSAPHGLLNYIAIPVIIAGLKLSIIREFHGLKPKHLHLYLTKYAEPGAMFALAAGAFIAFYRLAFYFTGKDIGTHRTVVYTSVIMLLFLLFPMLAKSMGELFTRPKKHDWKSLAPSMGCLAIASLSLFFALSAFSINKALSVVILAPLLTVILSAIFLKERFRVHQYFGFMIVLAGYVLILL